MTPTHRLRRGIALAVAVVAAVAAAMAPVTAGSASAAQAPDGTGWLRIAHLASGAPAVRVRLTAYDGSRTVALGRVRADSITRYQDVPAGLYTIAVVPASSAAPADPLAVANVRVNDYTGYSLLLTGKPGVVRAAVVQDDLAPPHGHRARINLVSALDDAVTVTADGRTLAHHLAPGRATGYAVVPARRWSVRLRSASTTTGGAVRLRPGSVYTLVAVPSAQDRPERLVAVLDTARGLRHPRGGASVEPRPTPVVPRLGDVVPERALPAW